MCGKSLPCNLISLWLGLQEAGFVPLNQTTNSPDNKAAEMIEVKATLNRMLLEIWTATRYYYYYYYYVTDKHNC